MGRLPRLAHYAQQQHPRKKGDGWKTLVEAENRSHSGPPEGLVFSFSYYLNFIFHIIRNGSCLPKHSKL